MRWHPPYPSPPNRDAMEGPYRAAVPMRLFANWEMDRASTSAVQRLFTLSISRLSLFPVPSQVRGFVITAKLDGYKRSLRSNEIVVGEVHGAIDIPLDVSFTIQYPHYLKHKRNVMQIHIQRKRKYKNRPIPGGFKSLAVGAIDLTAMLQCGSSQRAEIPLYAYSTSKQSNAPDVPTIGKLTMNSCATLPLDTDADLRREQMLPGGSKEKELSDDSEISDDDDSDLPDNGMGSARSEQRAANGGVMRDSQRRRKRAQRKNIKQRLVNLLKKFRVPDEGVEAAASSVGREPTAKELQALFDELDELSDSGNEGVAADEISIVSNPRPALRPYFSSREKLPLPAISDERASESEGDDLEWSSETEGGPALNHGLQTPTWRERSATTGFGSMAHSQTAGSLSAREKDKVARNASLSDQLYAILSSENNNGMGTIGGRNTATECIWLCQVPDQNFLTSLATAHNASATSDKHGPLHLVATNSLKDVRTAIQQIVAKIQMFCNSNSSPPPVQWVGVLGPDRLVSNVLRAYVDALAHKSSSSWLQYLRFALLVPPNSLTGRLVSGLDPALEQLCRDVWDRWSELSPAEHRSVAERIGGWPAGKAGVGGHGGCSLVNLPIGEALLHLSGNDKDREMGPDSSSRLFVPFLAEVRVGEDEGSVEGGGASPRPPTAGGGPTMREMEQNEHMPGQGSPPTSPQTKGGTTGDTQEMQVEYWLGVPVHYNNENSILMPLQPPGQPTTPQSKKDSSKGSLKAHFRTVVVARHSTTTLLSLTFVKEKRKEKMLQKLGMKNKQKSELDASPVQITNISRLLCSAQGKHTLSVVVDGCSYSDVRFFQTSTQWQTHVKHFPIGLLTPGLSVFA